MKQHSHGVVLLGGPARFAPSPSGFKIGSNWPWFEPVPLKRALILDMLGEWVLKQGDFFMAMFHGYVELPDGIVI